MLISENKPLELLLSIFANDKFAIIVKIWGISKIFKINGSSKVDEKCELSYVLDTATNNNPSIKVSLPLVVVVNYI